MHRPALLLLVAAVLLHLLLQVLPLMLLPLQLWGRVQWQHRRGVEGQWGGGAIKRYYRAVLNRLRGRTADCTSYLARFRIKHESTAEIHLWWVRLLQPQTPQLRAICCDGAQHKQMGPVV